MTSATRSSESCPDNIVIPKLLLLLRLQLPSSEVVWLISDAFREPLSFGTPCSKSKSVIPSELSPSDSSTNIKSEEDSSDSLFPSLPCIRLSSMRLAA